MVRFLGSVTAFSTLPLSGQASFLGEFFILFTLIFSVQVPIKKLDDELFVGDSGVEQHLHKVFEHLKILACV